MARKSRDSRKLRKRKLQLAEEQQFSADDLAFAAFAFLWAMALLFDYVQFFTMHAPWLHEYVMAATIVTGVLAALNPASIPRFLLLSACALIAVLVALPHVNNHELLFGVLSATFLAAFAILSWKRSFESSVTRSEFYQAFRAPTCWIVVVLYFWATVHKLNTGYLDKDLSCATMQLFNLQTHSVGGLKLTFVPTGDFVRYLAIYGTVVVEGSIPILLAIPRTRVAGVALAAVFHFVLGFGYPAFSVFIYSLLALFLPRSFWSAVLSWWPESLVNRCVERVASWRIVRNVLLVAFVGAALGAILTEFEYMVPARSKWAMRYTCWLIYGLAVMILFARLLELRREETMPRDRLFWPSLPSLMIAPVLLFLNGLAPHVGLKATQSFAMYSNLRTEDGGSNHLLFPASWQFFDHQKDLVTIVRSSDPLLAQLSRSSWVAHQTTPLLGTYILGYQKLRDRYPEPPTWKLPFISMKQHLRYVADRGAHDIFLVFIRNGEKHIVTQAESDPELADVPYWQRKLFRLRAVPSIEEGCCMW